MLRDLTNRQKAVLEFVRGYINECGYPPTVREVGAHFKIDPMSALFHLRVLERKGHIRRERDKPRAIKLIEPPSRKSEDLVEIPIVGEVPAGKPIIEDENLEGKIGLDKSFVKERKLFALKVKGNSMIDAHILHNDIVIVQEQAAVRNGEIVVALIKNERSGDYEATVKRFFATKNSICFKPENKNMKPIYIRRENAEGKIVGKVVAVFRGLK